MPTRLDLCPVGTYIFLNIENNRLLEMGVIPNQVVVLISNNILGIKIRIRNSTYLINNVVASTIYVRPIGE
jgi:Fe2+ transport system protein FeoA